MLQRKFYIETETGKSNLTDFLLAVMHDARATTFQYIKGITQEELDWQPYVGWNTIGSLLSHIIAGDHFFKIYFIEGRELTKDEEQQWFPGLDLGEHISSLTGKLPDYYLEELMRAHLEIKEAINNIPLEKLLEKRFDVYDKEKGSDLAWTLYHNAEDEVHHRGQISIIRKLYKKMREV